MKPVMIHGKVENFTIKLKGKDGLASCPNGCGGNVFIKPDDTRDELYECNSCKVWFECS